MGLINLTGDAGFDSLLLPMIYSRILPITAPVIDWEAYLKHTQALLGRSVTATLDSRGDFAYTIKSFVYTLAEFRKANSSILANPLLKHLHYAFMIVGTESLFGELMDYGLNVTTSEMKTVAIVSGDLRQWKAAVESGCHKDVASFFCRQVCNEVVHYFELLDIGDIFGEYKKIELKDKTFLLERK